MTTVHGTRLMVAALMLMALAGCAGQFGSQARAIGQGTGSLPLVGHPSSSPPASDGTKPAPSSSSGTSPSPQALPKGATSVVEAGDGFAIALPPGFARVTDPQKLDDAITSSWYYRSLPSSQRKAYRAQMRTALKLLAINRLTHRSLVITVTPAPGGRPEDVVAEQESLKSDLATVHATSVKVTRTKLDALPAVRSSYRVANGSGTLSIVQYLVVTNERLYVTSMNGATLATADTSLVVRTLHFPATGSGSVGGDSTGTI